MRMASLGIREGWELTEKWQRKKAEAGEGKGGGRRAVGALWAVRACGGLRPVLGHSLHLADRAASGWQGLVCLAGPLQKGQGG